MPPTLLCTFTIPFSLLIFRGRAFYRKKNVSLWHNCSEDSLVFCYACKHFNTSQWCSYCWPFLCISALSGIAEWDCHWTCWNLQQIDMYSTYYKILQRKLLNSVLSSVFLQPYWVTEILEDPLSASAGLHQCHKAHHGRRGALRCVWWQAPFWWGGVAAPRWIHSICGGFESHSSTPSIWSDDSSESAFSCVSEKMNLSFIWAV